MAGKRAGDSNPFYMDEIDDSEFLSHPKSGKSGYMVPNYKPNYSVVTTQQQSYEDKHQQLLMQKRAVEERTLQSSYRSLSLLNESEQIGIATADELNTQREQLENTEKRLDDINSSLRTSERHIQNIKSVFGSIKNYLGGRNSTNAAATGKPTTDLPVSQPKSTSGLGEVIEKSNLAAEYKSTSEHPALRTRGLGDRNVFEDDIYDSNFSSQVDSQLDQNLDEMMSSLSKLKGLGQNLQTEIEGQNEMLDRITDKTEGVDWKIEKQNKEMKKILKK